MTENYDVLKEKNLRQIVAEYEKERGVFVKEKQYSHDLMKEWALNVLEGAVQDDEKASSLFWEVVREYTKLFYSHAQANLVRKYAVIHDAKNINKYPVHQLSQIDDMMGEYNYGNYFPFIYSTLREILSKYNRGR